MNKIDVHADDYGLTLNTSRDIMEGINAGKLHSISIMPNTTCFDKTREYFYNHIERDKMPVISVHLNFMEGYCVSDKSELGYLVEEGLFHISWGTLVKYNYNFVIRNKVKEQLKKEIKAQLFRVIEGYHLLENGRKLRVDSHQHTHMIPAVFKALIKALTEEKITEAIDAICKIDMKDDVVFTVKSIEPIRKDDIYGGYCVRLDAIYDTIVTPLSIDVSTGDVITPDAVKYEFSGIFDEDIRISLWGYNIETVIAEKVETILRRGVFTTRPRDYYDVYILGTTQEYDKEIYKEALKATAEHRGSTEQISNVEGILKQISESDDLKDMWRKYQKKFAYASDISYENVLEVLRKIVL